MNIKLLDKAMVKRKFPCGEDVFSDSADQSNSKNPTAASGRRCDLLMADNFFKALKKVYQSIKAKTICQN